MAHTATCSTRTQRSKPCNGFCGVKLLPQVLAVIVRPASATKLHPHTRHGCSCGCSLHCFGPGSPGGVPRLRGRRYAGLRTWRLVTSIFGSNVSSDWDTRCATIRRSESVKIGSDSPRAFPTGSCCPLKCIVCTYACLSHSGF